MSCSTSLPLDVAASVLAYLWAPPASAQPQGRPTNQVGRRSGLKASAEQVAAFIQSKPAATHSLPDVVQKFNDRPVPVRVKGATNCEHVAWVYLTAKARRIVEDETGHPFTWHRAGRRVIYSQATGGL